MKNGVYLQRTDSQSVLMVRIQVRLLFHYKPPFGPLEASVTRYKSDFLIVQRIQQN